METHSIVILMAQTSTLLLAVFFFYLSRQKQQSFLLAWAIAWGLMSLHFIARAQFISPNPSWQTLAEWILVLSALAFYSAARLCVNAKLPIRIVLAAAAIGAAWAVANAYGTVSVTPGLGVGLIFLATAQTFWQEGRRQESHADTLLGAAFAGWGLFSFVLLFQPQPGFLQGKDLLPMLFLPELFTSVLMVMSVYEEERRRGERNMLALSNLSLATSSFAAGGINDMLAQALDRVLTIVRLPAGALCLQRRKGDGAKPVTFTGLSESFSSAMQESRLDDYLVNLVARLGGLVVLRDLQSEAPREAFEEEEDFRRLREILVAERLRTIVGISLQEKDRVFGVLLLGTPDNRSFTPAERRLLLALGLQIGMAIENSDLIQQTSRRSEELHILNEIGRALSSTLDRDALLERIYTEMRRAVDVGDFFIAFHDQASGEVRFEIEVVSGERVPRRSRPAGNHMVEYVARSGQPLLIGERFREEAQRLGFEPLQIPESLCAVPLILYDRSVGAMVVHSAREGAFDQGHVEFLRVLASEAGIALENARLFAEEQKKSRHLTLINNVSRHAITTLDPVQMLGEIAAEMQKELPYDHVGIAILDYSTKELVVQAAAGVGREAIGRRLSLDEGLLGQVARSSQNAAVRQGNPSEPRLLLPGSAASFALPVTYGEHFLGVLYVECSEPCDFPDQDVVLLRTLADLFAGALHNALTFQKAQEQAITDGLTGVKTHRFLMEALSSEWKRSTRANRPLALVLMDLDRFKFVNDFYGHLEGDVVLQRVAHILEQNCRRSDVVARYGGDEFVILMPETAIDHARQLANKLRTWIASDPLLRDKNITASFGIAAFPLHGTTPQELIQVADSSMYLSKHNGGNSVSSAEQGDPGNPKKWKEDVLEAYLGVTLKRLFTTGPEAFDEIYRRLEQFTRSLSEKDDHTPGDALPAPVVDTVTSLALAIDAKDQYTQGHSRKVSAYAAIIAQALGLSQRDIEEIRLAALLHDIGKVGIPESILNKSGPLSAAEWETMKTHTELGARILEPLKPMARIRVMVRHHHEFYDGTGYPLGLQGNDIPYGARVITVADAYDTITSARTYKKARSPEDAFAELQRCALTQFDPEIVSAFIDAMRRSPRPSIENILDASPAHQASPAL